MSLPIVFRRAARVEFDEAADWYERRRRGLGAEYVAEVQAVLDRIADAPESYATVQDDVREGLVKRFPFCVYYRVKPRWISVIAVFHTSRDPAIWPRRAVGLEA